MPPLGPFIFGAVTGPSIFHPSKRLVEVGEQKSKPNQGEIDDIRTTISSLTIFPYGDDRVEMPQWEEMNATTSCDWIIENSMHSKMTWKMHRSKKYKYQDMVPIFRVPKLPSWTPHDLERTFFRGEPYRNTENATQ